jgi:RNA polymerase sigma factor (TIGR02999 family)
VQDDHDVTRLLQELADGRPDAYERILGVIHEELRIMARARMRGERAEHTLQPTALVNEAFLRLARGQASYQNRAHFFGAAAEAMRRILVDHARERAARKRGGDAMRVTLHDLGVESDEPEIDLLALDTALDALAATDPRATDVVRLRYFAGMSVEDTAEVLGIAPATVKRDWTYARAWLLDRMHD